MKQKFNVGDIVLTEYRGNISRVIVKIVYLPGRDGKFIYNVAFSDEGSGFTVREDKLFLPRKDKLKLI